MASLTMTIVKEFAKQELAKMYRHSEFTYTNTNVFDHSAVSSAIESVNNQEMRFENNLKTHMDKMDVLKKLFFRDFFMIDPFIEIYNKPIDARFWI